MCLTAWSNKPCHRCGNNKGPTYKDKKYCYRCTFAVKKDAATKAHRAHVAKTYGIAVDDYDRLYIAQDGRCAICRRATGKSKRLAVDHDHKTGLVRGLLCGVCNNILGHARDDLEFFSRAVQYLTNPPARSVLEQPC